MAEDNNNIPKFEDTEPLFDDTEEIVDNSPTLDEPERMSKGQSFLKGAEQGLTLGFADELSGGIQSAMDKLAQLGVPGILPDGVTQTPDQQTQELLKQGFKGDLPSTYESARDSARQEYKQAETDHPGMYLGGNIAGGALTSVIPGGIGAKMMQPLGSASKGARLGERILTAGVNAMPVGAAVGLGMSEADNVKDLSKDALTGSLISGGLSSGLNLGGAGVSLVGDKLGKVIENKLPSIHTPYVRGKDGLVAFSEDFKNQTNTKAQELSNKIKDFVLGKRNELTQKNNQIIDTLGKQIDNTEKDIVNYRKALLEKQTGRLEKSKLGYAKQIEAKLLDQKEKIGKTYDVIEDQIKDSNVLFDVRQPIAELGENLQINGLLPDQAAAIQGRFMPYFERTDLTLPELKQMKMLANRMMQSNNPAVKGASKKMYGQIINNQIDSIEQAGLTDVANNLKNANQKYFKLMDLEENFIGDLSQDRVLKQTLTEDKTLSTLNDLIKTDAKSLNASDILQKKSDALDPQVGNLIGNITEDLQTKAANLKNLPSVESMKGSSGELQRLQSLLEQAKVKPEAKTQMDKLLQMDEKSINDYIGNNLDKVNLPVNTPARQNFENILSNLKQSTGEDLSKPVSEIAKDIDLVNLFNQEAQGSLSDKSLNFLKGVGSYGANLSGLAVKGSTPAAKAITSGAMRSSIEPITDKVNTTNNVFKQDINDVYANVKQFNTPEAQVYAKQLETAIQNGTQESKNAVLFSLMQQPAFRQMMKLNEAQKEK